MGSTVLKDPKRVNLLGVAPHLWKPNVEKNEVHPITPPMTQRVVQSAIVAKKSITPTYVKQVIGVIMIVELVHYLIHR